MGIGSTWYLGAKLRESALHAVIQNVKWDASDGDRKEWAEAVDLLVKAGADVNASYANYDWRGCGSTSTAFEMLLSRTASYPNPALLRLFLQHGANPNQKQVQDRHSMRTDGRSCHTPLHSAVRAGDVETSEVLLQAGAEVNGWATERMSNERGYGSNTRETAVHIACDLGNLELLALLHAHGADVNATRSRLHQQDLPDVQSPTDDPRDPTFVPRVRLVPVKETALHIALRRRSVELVQWLVQHGADTDREFEEGDTCRTPAQLCEQEGSNSSATTSSRSASNAAASAADLLAALHGPSKILVAEEVEADKRIHLHLSGVDGTLVADVGTISQTESGARDAITRAVQEQAGLRKGTFVVLGADGKDIMGMTTKGTAGMAAEMQAPIHSKEQAPIGGACV